MANRGMNRREFLGRAAVGAAAIAFGPDVFALAEKLSASAPGGRPNILLIMSDEHNASVTGCYGNTVIKTPAIDSLAARGVVFENCYTPSPLCVPCRQAVTAGKYASRVGVWDNSGEMPPDAPSIAHVMNDAGYESFLCGKMHYDSDRRYGFTEIGGNMNTGISGALPRLNEDILKSTKVSGRLKEFITADTSSVMRHDVKVTTGTVDFLANRKSGDKPFFLVAGYLAPHFPLTVPKEYFENYKGKVPLPKIPPGHLESQPLNYRVERSAFGVQDMPEETVRLGRELYYGLTQWVDDQMGKVLEALQKSELADNTVVIYTTDHGENMGEHGMWWKNTMYENAARIPLIVSYPKRWKGAQRRKGACGLLDVVKTVADIGGAKTPADWNGDSMLAWLDNPQTKWKDLAVSEYYGHNVASGFAMIRMGKWKYVYHTPADDKHAADRELYDLEADPGEFNNLAKDDAQKERIAQMRQALAKEVGEDPDKSELRCRKYLSEALAKSPTTKKAAGLGE